LPFVLQLVDKPDQPLVVRVVQADKILIHLEQKDIEIPQQIGLLHHGFEFIVEHGFWAGLEQGLEQADQRPASAKCYSVLVKKLDIIVTDNTFFMP
jgi:hypothetical protein